jgi:hypothetical protein
MSAMQRAGTVKKLLPGEKNPPENSPARAISLRARCYDSAGINPAILPTVILRTSCFLAPDVLYSVRYRACYIYPAGNTMFTTQQKTKN